ncbi:AraC-like ligand-binding domain-containing protein [Castellaniella defragrans]|uniref:AraC-like DNA-binding protein n=2 Tax=Castellaniella defragrans TaxID=75697 RepID=A0A7W9WQ35_CASDE|nr:helix-turn-helix domain-containing protein [Castellaniella defragrans]MBB6084500.1 AraC-like DNA-binding protein [Castellaniella defragrans]
MSAPMPQSAVSAFEPTWLRTPLRRFDTRCAWADAISEHFVPLEVEPGGNGPFRNLAANETLGCLQVSELVTSAQRVRRTRVLASRSESAQYKFSVQISGRTLIAQDGRSALLDPGDWGIYDTSRPYEISEEPNAHFLVLQVPAHVLSVWEPWIQSQLARRFGSGSGSARVAMDALRALVSQGPALGPELAFEVSSTVMRLFALSLGEHADGGGASSLEDVRQGQLRVILHHVHEHLHDGAMNADTLARRFRMSRRYLYKLFAARGLTPADYILGARLERCRELLADPACTRQIGELAYAHGFIDTSAFSHAFRRRFGLSPSEWRARHARPARERALSGTAQASAGARPGSA